jgi:acyl-CoA reductase-like NAD-dependent aldehyde dehydrogenase
MSIGREEIFGPVLSIKTAKIFDEGVDLINEGAKDSMTPIISVSAIVGIVLASLGVV